MGIGSDQIKQNVQIKQNDQIKLNKQIKQNDKIQKGYFEVNGKYII